VELLDRNGQVVARAGDHIQAGGGYTTIGDVEGFSVCPAGIEVQPAQP
jgi:hypothetical protein